MKLLSFIKDGKERLGIFVDDKIYDLEKSGLEAGIQNTPSKMQIFLQYWDRNFDFAHTIHDKIKTGKISKDEKSENIRIISPVPYPTSCRDGYAFRQHVETARRNRGVEMIPEFDQFPVFYFTNHNSIIGEGAVIVEKDQMDKLDFELEAAILIKKAGKNISAQKADDYVAGYMVMNDFSARTLQMQEMKLNLGPAKGKDFATALGPFLVTVDELEKYKIETPSGNKYDLEMKAFHNGKEISHGNLKDMNWTFAEIIERASYGVELLPGDVIGSGTVGTGCYLELNGTWALEAKKNGKEFEPVWLEDGDSIELEITGLGRLNNKVVKSKNEYSIPNRAKKAN
jgi:fumarylacetoacetate (FAA) hydrolase